MSNKGKVKTKKSVITFDKIFTEAIEFADEFNAMQEFNKKYNFYPPEFKEIVYAEETEVTSIIDVNALRQLDNGIKLAKTVFELFQHLDNTPNYQEGEDSNASFAVWMNLFKNHVVNILKIFRNSFCKNHI